MAEFAKSESTKSIEWTLAISDHDGSFREPGITVVADPECGERRRRGTTAGLLDSDEINQQCGHHDINQNVEYSPPSLPSSLAPSLLPITTMPPLPLPSLAPSLVSSNSNNISIQITCYDEPPPTRVNSLIPTIIIGPSSSPPQTATPPIALSIPQTPPLPSQTSPRHHNTSPRFHQQHVNYSSSSSSPTTTTTAASLSSSGGSNGVSITFSTPPTTTLAVPLQTSPRFHQHVNHSSSSSSSSPTTTTTTAASLSSSGGSNGASITFSTPVITRQGNDSEKYVTVRNKSIRAIDTSFSTTSSSSTPSLHPHPPAPLSADSHTGSSTSLSCPPSPNFQRTRHSFSYSSPTPSSVPSPISAYGNYYDIASTPSLLQHPPSSSTVSSAHFPAITPMHERNTPFSSRMNSENIYSSKLFKYKYLLEFNCGELEMEYIASCRAVCISQQRYTALAIAILLFIDALVNGTQFYGYSTLKYSLVNPILYFILFILLSKGITARHSQEIIPVFYVLIMLACQMEVQYKQPLDLQASLSGFLLMTMFSVYRVKFKNTVFASAIVVLSQLLVVIGYRYDSEPWYQVLASPIFTLSVALIGCFTCYLVERKEREVLVQRYIMQVESNKMACHSKRDQALLLSIFPRALLSELEKHNFRTKHLSPSSMQQSLIGFNQLSHFHHSYENVSILVADVVGFTSLSSTITAKEVVSLLNHIFAAFDELCCKFGLEKVRTIGDAYLAVGNMTMPLADHQTRTLALGWEMIQYMDRLRERDNKYDINVRIGVDCGPVYAGVTGLSKWNYDIFGTTLNGANHMEQSGVPGIIQVTDRVYQAVKDKNHVFSFNQRECKDDTKSYFVAAKLERSGSSGLFISFIEANHQTLTFEAFQELVDNNRGEGLNALSDYVQPSQTNPVLAAIVNTTYYKKMQAKAEEEIISRKSQRSLSVPEFDESILGYDVMKETLSTQIIEFSGLLLPRFSKKYENQYQAKTALARQDYSDVVTRWLFGCFLLWVAIDLFEMNHWLSLVWASHALAVVSCILFFLFVRSHWFTRPWSEFVIASLLFCMASAIVLRRYSTFSHHIPHLRVEPLIFSSFVFYYFYVRVYFVLPTIVAVYVATLVGLIAVENRHENILYITSRYLIMVTSCFMAGRMHNKNMRKEFLVDKLIKNDIDHEQRAIARTKLLLYNLFPSKIVARLSINPTQIADYYDAVTIAFINISNFHDIEDKVEAGEIMDFLNEVFVLFDNLSIAAGVEKIKTINSKYMVASGIPTIRLDHTEAALNLVLRMFKVIKNIRTPRGGPVVLRVGMASGPVVAGIIGKSKYSYDCWSDTVNTASRMESLGEDGLIQVTESVYKTLHDKFKFQKRAPLAVKGKGMMTTYLLDPADATLEDKKVVEPVPSSS